MLEKDPNETFANAHSGIMMGLCNGVWGWRQEQLHSKGLSSHHLP
jgi:hypothetical protein